MSSSVLSLVLYTMLGAAVALGLTAGQMQSGADLTTRRVGDAIQYTSGCHTVEDMTRLARSEDFRGLADKLVREGKCFQMPSPAAAVLKKWRSGPYKILDLHAASVWQILDQFGDVEFALFFDLGGPHEAQQDAS